jgi:hypothetical protein
MDLGPLEADLATMHDDLARIAGRKHSLGTEAVMALEQIIAEAGASRGSGEDALGFAFQDALYKILRDGAVTDMAGNTHFAVDQKAFQEHAAPVVKEVVGVVQTTVQSLLDELTGQVATGIADVAPATPVAGQPAEGGGAASPDPAPAGPKLKVDLGSLFAGLLQNIVTQAAQQAPKKKD